MTRDRKPHKPKKLRGGKTHNEPRSVAGRHGRTWAIPEDEQDWRFRSGYPFALRGAWRGGKEWRGYYWRKARAHARDCLQKLEEPEPERPRGRVKWDLY